MRHVFVALVASMFLLGVGSVSSALDLGMDKMKEKASGVLGSKDKAKEEAKDEAKEMGAKEESKGEDQKGIKSQAKEMIKEKVDDAIGK